MSQKFENFLKSENFQKLSIVVIFFKNCQKLSENVSNVLFQPMAGHKFQAMDCLMTNTKNTYLPMRVHHHCKLIQVRERLQHLSWQKMGNPPQFPESAVAA